MELATSGLATIGAPEMRYRAAGQADGFGPLRASAGATAAASSTASNVSSVGGMVWVRWAGEFFMTGRRYAGRGTATRRGPSRARRTAHRSSKPMLREVYAAARRVGPAA